MVKRGFDHFLRINGKKVDESIGHLHPGESIVEYQKIYYKKKKQKIIKLLVGVLILTLLCMGKEMWSDHVEIGYLARNPPGGGANSYTLTMDADTIIKGYPIEITLDEQVIKDVEDALAAARAYIEEHYLGENTDADHIQTKMNFMTTVPIGGVTVTWVPKDYQLLSAQGQIFNEELTDPVGTAVVVYMKYKDIEKNFEIPITVVPVNLEGKEQIIHEVKQEIKRVNDENKTEETVVLPTKMDDYNLSWREPKQYMAIKILFLGVIMVIIISFYQDQKLSEEVTKKEQVLLQQYPDFVYKFVLLLGAGMNANHVWAKITEEYQISVEEGHEEYQYLLDEMLVTRHQMEAGISEGRAYEDFGKRCRLSVYLKFCSLLVQSLKRGAKGMNQLFLDESDQAVLIRKENAKRMGEEAGIKLLMPMMGLFALVLMIIMIPALMTMNV